MSGLSLLLFDSSLERSRSTQFLLQLAGYRVELVQSGEEAFNWLASRSDSLGQASLLLINDHRQLVEMLDLLPELTNKGLDIPVLSVMRKENSGDSEAEVPGQITLCRPDGLLGHVRLLTRQFGGADLSEKPQNIAQ